jgi:two-component system CitB family response regulator
MTVKRTYAGGRKILVVDDHASSGRHAATALSQCTGQVQWVKTASEALLASLSWLPDTIFMDLHLPDAGGLEVIRRIRSNWPADKPEPTIVVVTADVSPGNRKQLAQLKVSHVLLKPVPGEQLRAVAELTGRSGIQEPRSGEIQSEFRALFRDELEQRLPGLDSGLSKLDYKSVTAVLHQLIASAAFSGESRLEQSLRSLDTVCRQSGAPGEIARRYYEFLESAQEFMSRKKSK